MSEPTREPEGDRRGAIWLALAAFVLGVGGGGLLLSLWRADSANASPQTMHDDAFDADTSPLAEMNRRRKRLFDVDHSVRDTLGLKTLTVEFKQATRRIPLPAFVRELRSVSDIAVAARSDAVIRRWLVSEGQAVRPGDPIVELELTGEALASAQTELLQAVQQREIAGKEIKRLEGVAKQGGLAGTRLLAQQYDAERLDAEIIAKRQQLAIFGLSADEVTRIESERKLIRRVVLSAPELPSPQDSRLGQESEAAPPPAASPSDDAWVFAVETLGAPTGAWVKPGDTLATLAFHAEVAIEGQAYERDMPWIEAAARSSSIVHIELGSDEAPITAQGSIAFIDNKLDPVARTQRVYVMLPNTIALDSMRNGRRYRSWRMKPGQRGHMLIPAGDRGEGVVLPVDAVARDGEAHFVFRWVATHANEDPPHDEYRPLQVSVLDESLREIVVSKESLAPGDRLAANQAFRLMLMMKDQLEEGQGGGHHGHHHDH